MTDIQVIGRGARGAVGIDIVGSIEPGEYLVKAAGAIRKYTGVASVGGADAALRTDLADNDGTGAALVSALGKGDTARVISLLETVQDTYRLDLAEGVDASGDTPCGAAVQAFFDQFGTLATGENTKPIAMFGRAGTYDVSDVGVINIDQSYMWFFGEGTTFVGGGLSNGYAGAPANNIWSIVTDVTVREAPINHPAFLAMGAPHILHNNCVAENCLGDAFVYLGSVSYYNVGCRAYENNGWAFKDASFLKTYTDTGIPSTPANCIAGMSLFFKAYGNDAGGKLYSESQFPLTICDELEYNGGTTGYGFRLLSCFGTLVDRPYCEIHKTDYSDELIAPGDAIFNPTFTGFNKLRDPRFGGQAVGGSIPTGCAFNIERGGIIGTGRIGGHVTIGASAKFTSLPPGHDLEIGGTYTDNSTGFSTMVGGHRSGTVTFGATDAAKAVSFGTALESNTKFVPMLQVKTPITGSPPTSCFSPYVQDPSGGGFTIVLPGGVPPGTSASITVAWTFVPQL